MADRQEAWNDMALQDYIINTEGTFLKVASKIDNNTGTNIGISFPHHEQHEGDHYNITDFMTLGSGGTASFIINTPVSGKEMHITWSSESSGPAEMIVYRNGSVTGTVGTSITPLNNNEMSSNVSQGTFEYNPTIVDFGTRMQGYAWGDADVPARALGGDSREDDELILGTNMFYIYHFISKEAANVISYAGKWYEHTPTIS